MKLLVTFWLGYALTWSSVGDPVSASLVDLFYVARSKDAKTIHYQLRLTADGSIDTENPLDIFWLISTRNGLKSEKLSWIQNKYAYGIQILSSSPDSLSFHFVSYNKKIILVKKGTEGEYEAYITCNNSYLILEKIFVQIDGGSFWFPKISSVKLEGKDLNTLDSRFEIIQP